MHEFYCAYTHLLNHRHRKFVIPVLLEDLGNLDCNPNQLKAREVLQTYLRTYTYIDARKFMDNIEKVRKRIIFNMPAVPLMKLREGGQSDEDNITEDEQNPLLPEIPQ